MVQWSARRTMRLGPLSAVFVFAVIAVAQVVAADLPFTAAGLGHLEGALDSCARAIPKSAAEYQKQKERLVQGVSDKDLADVRAAGEYQETYKAISDQFENASEDQAADACKVFLGTAATPRDTNK
jgi:hypothetical protein